MTPNFVMLSIVSVFGLLHLPVASGRFPNTKRTTRSSPTRTYLQTNISARVCPPPHTHALEDQLLFLKKPKDGLFANPWSSGLKAPLGARPERSDRFQICASAQKSDNRNAMLLPAGGLKTHVSGNLNFSKSGTRLLLDPSDLIWHGPL